ncbi:vesicle-associated protein 2-1-like isoform X2 [Prosopis cineraria]|uniref:vesicle-associated protein 2-1-like isoform X2 n=1 Tax=Prosopis cineraria TaxID=364024 RepID=UPI00240EADE4|nr:vesicle-associated protein 2-1-like isoform X2 [Prosopis cineraria]
MLLVPPPYRNRHSFSLPSLLISSHSLPLLSEICPPLPLPSDASLCCFNQLAILETLILCLGFVMSSAAAVGNSLISVTPDELRFQFELEKPSFCEIKVSNNTGHHVAFKVKTTSPKKYFVRPNTGIVQPEDSCIIRVTLHVQHEYPTEVQRKDKFLLQSTVVNPNTKVDELSSDIFGMQFNKDSGKSTIEECRLRVVFLCPNSAQGNLEDEALKRSIQDLDSDSALQRLKEERDAANRQTMQLRQELDMMKRRKIRGSDQGFSFGFAIFVGLIGTLLGLLLKLSLS